jgi:hypothetical protein
MSEDPETPLPIVLPAPPKRRGRPPWKRDAYEAILHVLFRGRRIVLIEPPHGWLVVNYEADLPYLRMLAGWAKKLRLGEIVELPGGDIAFRKLEALDAEWKALDEQAAAEDKVQG